MKPSGSTVTATFRELLLDSRDTWFGATDLCLGPDGAVYVSDFYDKRTAHPDPDADWDRSNGRIYKIMAVGAKPTAKFDLAKLNANELVELLKHPNGWYADRARMLLAEKGGRASSGSLRELARQQKDPKLALRGLWALNVTGGFDEAFAEEMLKHSGAVRPCLDRAAARRREESLPGNREAVGGTCRVRSVAGRPGATPLHREAASGRAGASHHRAASTPRRGRKRPGHPVALVVGHREQGDERSRADRCLLRLGGAPQACRGEGEPRPVGSPICGRRHQERVRRRAQVAHGCPDAERNSLLEDLDRGLAERAVGLPAVGQGGLFDTLAQPGGEPAKPARMFEPLTPELDEFIGSAWEDLPASTVRLRLAIRADIATAREFIHAELANAKTQRAVLLDRLAILQELGDAGCVPVVLPLLASTDADVQKHAIAVLSRVGGAEVGQAIVKAYPTMNPTLQSRAREVLFGRKEWAKAFLALVDSGKVAPAAVPVEQVRLLAFLGDKDIDIAVRKHWGNVKPGTPEEKLAEVRRFSNDLRAGSGDATPGRHCSQSTAECATSCSARAERVGPDLTNTSRADTAWLLASIVDPSSVVRAQYVQYALRTTDEVVHTGIIAEQDGASVTLVDAKGEKTRVPRERIDSLRELSTSLMPEKLLDALSPQERRDLFRYLQQPGK